MLIATRLGELLQSGRHVHPLPVHIAILLDDNVAEVDADAKMEGLGRLLRGLCCEGLLNRHRTADGFHRACKLTRSPSPVVLNTLP